MIHFFSNNEKNLELYISLYFHATVVNTFQQ